MVLAGLLKVWAVESTDEPCEISGYRARHKRPLHFTFALFPGIPARAGFAQSTRRISYPLGTPVFSLRGAALPKRPKDGAQRGFFPEEPGS